MLIVRARARANPVLRSVLIVLAVLIVLWLAWLSGSMRLGALASVDRWRQITVSPFEGDNGHKALCPLSRPQNPGIMLDDGAGIHAWYMQ